MGQCPFAGHAGAVTPAAGTNNHKWWPEQLDLSILHQHNRDATPLRKDFNYAEEFNKINYDELKNDIFQLMQESQDWWPADWGHYGAFFIRMAWHSAGTYRSADGRGGAGGGNQRFAPLNSWPDNINLDKARRLLWPVKQKYGLGISWADLILLAGHCALQSMGLPTFGFAAGREDLWEPEADILWGRETSWLSDDRHHDNGKLEAPFSATEMGLIYVNPEGPKGHPDPVASGREVRDTFSRMGMNNEETVALIAGGHTFGKAHGAGSSDHVGPEPEAASIEAQGLGWSSSLASGVAEHTISSGIEGAWKPNPTRWDGGYFEMMFTYDWELTKSPAGAWQWQPINVREEHLIPDAHDPSKSSPPMMTTADLSLKHDPVFEPISRHFRENQQDFADAFARAWFKLTHRDLGPRCRYLGPEVPSEVLIWQDPIPASSTTPPSQAELDTIKGQIAATGLSDRELIETAWASASTFRQSDKRGGANGGRIRLMPQRSWDVNQPDQLEKVLGQLSAIPSQLSMADLIVLAGGVGIERAAQAAGHALVVPFTPGRSDADQAQTDTATFSALKPIADGFRNYKQSGVNLPGEQLLIDRAQLLSLTAPELTALIGGFRSVGITAAGTSHGLLTDTIGTLNNAFFINLLDMQVVWNPLTEGSDLFEGITRQSGERRWTATRADLIFGSNAQLRAIAEAFAQNGGQQLMLDVFVQAWVKVMNLDRFDLR